MPFCAIDTEKSCPHNKSLGKYQDFTQETGFWELRLGDYLAPDCIFMITLNELINTFVPWQDQNTVFIWKLPSPISLPHLIIHSTLGTNM